MAHSVKLYTNLQQDLAMESMDTPFSEPALQPQQTASTSQMLYMPIDSPPTPAPSPGPPTILQPISSLLALPQNPVLRRQYLSALLHSCTSTELLFISNTIAPLLKRDFLRALPIELALHVLHFVDEPKTLARAAQVSRWWRRLVNDETLWKRLCKAFRFDENLPSGAGFSFREHFKYYYTITQNWYKGGHLLRAHRVPASSITTQDSGVVTSLALNADWVVVGLANCRIHVFSAQTGVLSRTLVGHELGVWAVCLVGSGGWMDGPGRSEQAGDREFRRPENPRSSYSESDIETIHNKDVREDIGSDGSDYPGHQFLPPSLRIALGLRPRADSEEEGDWDSDNQHHTVFNEDAELEDMDVDVDIDHGNGTESRHPGKPSSATGYSEGWGQPNALVVSGGCDKAVRVWDIRSGYCIYTLHGHSSTIRCIKVLHNRPLAVSGSRDNTVRVWDIQKGQLSKTLEGHTASVRCLDVCGNRVVSGSYDTTCRLWDVDTGQCIHILQGHLHQIYSVAFDGIRIASGGLDTTVRVWDAETGECKATLQGHTALVCQLQLDRNMLATGGSDGRVIVFSLPMASLSSSSSTYHNHPSSPDSSTSRENHTHSPSSFVSHHENQFHYTPLHRIAAHDSSVTSLQFDRRLGLLVTGGNDGRVRVWEVETGLWVRDLTSAQCSPGLSGEGFGDPSSTGRDPNSSPRQTQRTERRVRTRSKSNSGRRVQANSNFGLGECECVWKVGFAYSSPSARGSGGAEVCAIMCRRQGKTVMEIWSLKPREEAERVNETEEGEGEGSNVRDC